MAIASRQSTKRRLCGQVVVITGGSRGLGLALAREFAGCGCRIAICARDKDHLDAARRTLEDRGVEVSATVCDVSDRNQVDAMIDGVRQRFGRIDILVNNAGQIRVASVEDSNVADFEQAMGVMFWGVVYPTLKVLPEMQQRRAGSIITITSIGGKVSVPHLVPYSCAKFAAVGFCEGLRAEMARSGVNVTTVIPGLMRTGSHRNASFGGEPAKEAAWFGLAASLPLISMNAECAARKIVRAAARGKADHHLTPQAALLSRLHGISPGFVTGVLSQVNRLLPAPSVDRQTERGIAIEDQMPGWWKAATVLGRRAAARLNQ